MFNKSVMDLNTLLFDNVNTKIVRIRVRQDQVVSKYVPSSIPVSIACKDQNIVSNQYFWYYSLKNNVGAGNPLRRLLQTLGKNI